jgi:hypothetical protein
LTEAIVDAITLAGAGVVTRPPNDSCNHRNDCDSLNQHNNEYSRPITRSKAFLDRAFEGERR